MKESKGDIKTQRKSIISKRIFDQETSLCETLSKQNNGKCNWGKCDECGVLPLLYKFRYGKILENKDEIKQIKK